METGDRKVAILYVEDEPETRELIGNALASEYPDISLYSAADGAEGLALFREHRPEVVLTDIKMPVMDGLVMVGEIIAFDPETEIIALTAYSDTSFLLSAIEAGFSHYVMKPVDCDRLFAAVGKSLQVVNLKRRVQEQNDQIRQFASELERKVEDYRSAIIDITKLKEAEEKIYRLNRLYSMLTATGKAIVRAAGEEDLFREICRITVEEGGFAQACIGLVDAEGREVRPVAKSTVAVTCHGKPFTCFAEKLDEPCPVTTAIKENSYYVVNDCLNDPDAGYAYHIGKECGFRSTAAFALKMAGQAVGALSIYADEVDYFDQQMTELLDQMTRDISFALENMDRERRRREAEEALHRESVAKLEAVEELRRKEQLLLQQNRMAAMGEMIGNIAHQWRQPLNLLGIMVQELPLAFEVGAFNQEYLQKQAGKAMEVIHQMSTTIDDFRNFFQPDNTRVRFRISEVVRKAVSFIAAAYKARNIELEVTGEEEEIAVTGFPGQFSQVILNLLMNARDVFVERSVANPKVCIRIFPENGRGVVTVTDNGGGIPGDVVGRIFEPYFTTKGPKGTGIGLFMSKSIIEKNMSGRLTVRNTGEGAEFKIEV